MQPHGRVAPLLSTPWLRPPSSTIDGPRDGNPYSTLIEGRSVIVSFATVTELRFGAISGNWGELRRQDLERDLRIFTIIQPDDKLMMHCAQLRSACEFAGHPLGQNIYEADRWIAATALSGGLDLVSG
jgi:predicted nucleic acid-binding protein